MLRLLSMSANVRGNQRGFTLIELMMVMATMGLLSATLGPAVVDSMERARNGLMMVATRQVQTFMEVYALDNGRYPDGISGSDVEAQLAPYVTMWPKDPWNSNLGGNVEICRHPVDLSLTPGDIVYEPSHYYRHYTLKGYGTGPDGGTAIVIVLKNHSD